ncbi:hypothetical protein [Yersinia mollaretii]|uniref:Metalloprotease StcE beta-sandwich domain-containing protein n=1 Tax=Yersinia mollaretii TaxID=33060 RepID=A0AA36PJK2_YERMO|nr:hypothetical protein [Yersinia mollaretii]CNI15605.1 Uncharacterised protein [Yersinia mollaretii]
MSSSFLSTTPNQLGSGVLPSHYDEIVFELSEANWVKDIILPDQPPDRCIVTIYSSATQDTVLHLPFGSLIMKTDSVYYLEYHTGIQQWDIQGPDFNYLTPDNLGDHVLQDNMSYETPDSTVHITMVPNTTNNHNEVDEYPNTWASEENDSMAMPSMLLTSYKDIIKQLLDSDWVGNITMPDQSDDKSTATIIFSATEDAMLHLPSGPLKIKSGTEYNLEYDANRQQWYNREADINDETPDLIPKNRSTRSVIEDSETIDSRVVYTIPESSQKVTDYVMDNNNWAAEIRLPSTAEDESTMTIHSTAIRDSKISSENLLYPCTTTIKSDDQYVFKYLKKFSRWALESAPVRNIEFDRIQSEIPFPTSPTTMVTMTDSHWREKIKLPERAADRDKITLKSSTDAVTHIDTDNVNEPGVMKLRNGEQYDFFYIAEKGKWQLISSPDTFYQAQDITNGLVPILRTPRTIINAADGNYQPELRLPTGQEPGSRVIINSRAEWDISVSADETNYKVLNGETVAFKVNEQGRWQRESITIDLLLLYSDKAAAHSGKDKVHDFMMKGFNMTNEALENSGANFRYRMVGLREIAAKADWINMYGMLDNLRKDPLVQEWLDSLKADGVYYVGTEEGTGHGWLNNVFHPEDSTEGIDETIIPDPINLMDRMYMVSVGPITSDPEVMRHELGHNMGLRDRYGCNPNIQECELVATIMNQMWTPYYSTPDHYTADYGIPMGIPGKFDDVLAMNKISPAVAAYR